MSADKLPPFTILHIAGEQPTDYTDRALHPIQPVLTTIHRQQGTTYEGAHGRAEPLPGTMGSVGVAGAGIHEGIALRLPEPLVFALDPGFADSPIVAMAADRLLIEQSMPVEECISRIRALTPEQRWEVFEATRRMVAGD